MNILLISHDFDREIPNREDFLNDAYPMYGPNLLATVLRKHGHEVTVLDRFYHELCNEKEEMPFEKRIKAIVETQGIDIVGITVMSDFRHQCFGYARLAKNLGAKLQRDIKVVAGGPHVTALAEQVVKYYHADVDVAVVGEGEETLPELISVWQEQRDLSNVKGIVFWDENINQPVRTEPRPPLDLNQLPYPDYDQYGSFKTAMLHRGRGCSYGKCKFCFPNFVLWGRVRLRSPKHILDEINHLVYEHGVTILRIWDDDFLAQREQAMEVFRGIQERGCKLELYTQARFDSVSKELLEEFRRAGGQAVYLALESGSERLRSVMEKDLPQRTVYEISRLVKNTGLDLGVFVMLGYPGEVDADIEETWRVLRDIQPEEISCSLTRHYPGTPIYKEAVAQCMINDDDWVFESRPTFFCVSNDRVSVLKGIQKAMMQQFSKKRIRPSYEWDDKAFEYIYRGNDLNLTHQISAWTIMPSPIKEEITRLLVHTAARSFELRLDPRDYTFTTGKNLMGAIWAIDPECEMKERSSKTDLLVVGRFGYKGELLEQNLEQFIGNRYLEARDSTTGFFKHLREIGAPLIVNLLEKVLIDSTDSGPSHLSKRLKDAFSNHISEYIDSSAGILSEHLKDNPEYVRRISSISSQVKGLEARRKDLGALLSMRNWLYSRYVSHHMPYKERELCGDLIRKIILVGEEILDLTTVYSGNSMEEIFSKISKNLIAEAINDCPEDVGHDSFNASNIYYDKYLSKWKYRSFLFFDLDVVEEDWIKKGTKSKYAKTFSGLERVKDIPSKYMIMSPLTDAEKVIGFIYFGIGDRKDPDDESIKIQSKFDITERNEEGRIKLTRDIDSFLEAIFPISSVAMGERDERLVLLNRISGIRAMAHDIGNPCSRAEFLIGKLKGARIGWTGEEEDWIEEIEEVLGKTKDRMRTLMREQFTFEGQIPDRSPVNINNLILETIRNVLESHINAKGFGIEKGVDLQLDDNIPETNVDLEKIGKVFENIIVNSLENPKTSNIRVESSVYESKYIDVVFSDDGGGVNWIGDPNELLDGGYTTKEKDGGRGLAIVYENVRLHGGAVNLENIREKDIQGFRVFIELPIEVG